MGCFDKPSSGSVADMAQRGGVSSALQKIAARKTELEEEMGRKLRIYELKIKLETQKALHGFVKEQKKTMFEPILSEVASVPENLADGGVCMISSIKEKLGKGFKATNKVLLSLDKEAKKIQGEIIRLEQELKEYGIEDLEDLSINPTVNQEKQDDDDIGQLDG